MTNRTTAGMNLRIQQTIAILLAMLFIANGSAMLFAPDSWYLGVPGVADRGPFNQHFIRDIGMLYLVTGVGFMVGALYAAYRVALWAIGAAWHLGHALFHVWEVLAGLCGPAALTQDFAGVLLPGVLALLIAVLAWRQSRHNAVPAG